MQVCTTLQTDNHASNPPLSFFTGQMSVLLTNQQRQSTEGIKFNNKYENLIIKIHLATHTRLTALFPGLPG